MMRRYFLLLTLVLLFIAEGCAKTKTYNPFKVSQDEFYVKTRVIALVPIAVPADLDRAELVKVKFDSLIEATLHESGLTIVPSGEVAAVWKSMSARVGGFVNPDTGERDESKFKVVKEHTLRELSAKFSVDAVLYPSIAVFKAHWGSGVAQWHGISESITPNTLPFMLLNPLVGHSRGTVPALSLYVVVEDIHGAELYENAGGIQVLAKLVSTYDFKPVPQDQLFVDEAKNLKAVKIALGALKTKLEPGGTPHK
jgi:hypothetical protein